MGQLIRLGRWAYTVESNKSVSAYIHTPSISILSMGAVAMGDMKHLVIAKFKEGVVVEDIQKGLEKLVSEINTVKSFEWGEDMKSDEMLRQGFTHIISMTFSSSEDFAAFLGHPSHAEFSATFSAAIEKILLFDFPTVVIKAPA